MSRGFLISSAARCTMSTGEALPSATAGPGELGDTADTETETEVREVTACCEAGSRSPGSGLASTLASSSWTESGTGAGEREEPFLSGER